MSFLNIDSYKMLQKHIARSNMALPGAIWYCLEVANNDLSRMLLKSGADCNLPMEDGRTPLHIAAETGAVT